MSEAREYAQPDNNSESAKDVDEARQRAIAQIQRRRRFKRELIISSFGMLLLVLIWAQSEYHNAGGWPTSGFSHSSSIPNVWNYWIIYPIILWALIMGYRGWALYGNKPISESEIEKEMKRDS